VYGKENGMNWLISDFTSQTKLNHTSFSLVCTTIPANSWCNLIKRLDSH